MAPRADFLRALRDADERLAAIPPGLHIEAHIRASVRHGTPLPVRSRATIFDRLRRPVLTVAFVTLGALALVGSTGDSELAPHDAIANGKAPPEERAPEVAPEGPSPPSADDSACDDRGTGSHCRPHAGGPESHSDPAGGQRAPSPGKSGAPPPKEREASPLPRTRIKPRDGALPLDSDVVPIGPDRWERPLSPPPPGAPPPSPPGAPLARSFGVHVPPVDGAADPSPRPLRTGGAARFGSASPGDPEPGVVDSAPPASADDVPSTGTDADDEAQDEAMDCKSPAVWKEYVWEECEKQGLSPTYLELLDDCGNGTYMDVEFKCAASDPASEPDPNDSVCSGGVLGDGTTCEPHETWKLLADQSCAAQGLSLVDLAFGAECEAGASAFAKYVCCGGPPPDPEPSPASCLGYELSGECLSASEVKQQAYEHCASEGLFVGDLVPIQTCEGDGISHAKFLCCKGK